MKPGQGKNKGSCFERVICKQLSQWWTSKLGVIVRDDVFYRSSASGGRATIRRKKNQDTAYSVADVGLQDPLGAPFLDCCLVEMKKGYSRLNGQKIDPFELLDCQDTRQSPPLLLFFWFKAEKEAEGREPWLILQRDRHRICVVMNQFFFEDMEEFCGKYQSTYFLIDIPVLKWKGMKLAPAVFLVIVALEELLNWLDPQFFIQRSFHAQGQRT